MSGSRYAHPPRGKPGNDDSSVGHFFSGGLTRFGHRSHPSPSPSLSPPQVPQQAYLSSLIAFVWASPCPRPIQSRISKSPTAHMDNARVLVTAPPTYASRLAQHLMAHNARPILAPTISTVPLPEHLSSDLQHAILTLSDYDIIAFTSRSGIRSFAEHLLSISGHDESIAAMALSASGVQIAALGADAHAVKQFLSRTPDIIPLEPSPNGLVHHLQQDPRLKGSQVLCPLPYFVDMPEPDVISGFLNALKEAGFVARPVSAYVTRPTHRNSNQVELSLLCDGSIPAIIISSVGEAVALGAILTDRERQDFVSRVLQSELILAAHGPFTAQGIRYHFELEEQHVLVSQDFSSFEGVVVALEKRLSKSHGVDLQLMQ